MHIKLLLLLLDYNININHVVFLNLPIWINLIISSKILRIIQRKIVERYYSWHDILEMDALLCNPGGY